MTVADGALTEKFNTVTRHLGETADLRIALLRRGFKLENRWAGVMSQRLDPFWRPADEILEKMGRKAKEAERNSSHFEAAMSPYLVERLAMECEDKFGITRGEARALHAIHEQRIPAVRSLYARVSLKGLAGLIIGVFGFAAAQVPKESFEEFGLLHTYGWYRLALVAVMVLSLAYAATLSLLAGPTARKSLFRLRVIEVVLVFLVACRAEPDDDDT
jgi:hypothetical protein